MPRIVGEPNEKHNVSYKYEMATIDFVTYDLEGLRTICVTGNYRLPAGLTGEMRKDLQATTDSFFKKWLRDNGWDTNRKILVWGDTQDWGGGYVNRAKTNLVRFDYYFRRRPEWKYQGKDEITASKRWKRLCKETLEPLGKAINDTLMTRYRFLVNEAVTANASQEQSC